MSDNVEQRSLRAIARTRALGLHFYGHFLGIDGPLPTPGDARLTLEGEPAGVGQGAPSISALATLADLTLGSAVRSRLTPGTLLATATLSLQLLTLDAPGPIRAEASAPVQADASQGLARGALLGPHGPIGHAQAWF